MGFLNYKIDNQRLIDDDMKGLDSGRLAKAQASLEFMFIFMLFVAALTIVAVYVSQGTQSVFSSRLDLEAEGVMSLVKGKLDTAYLEGSGFSTNLTLPQEIIGFDYSVNVTNGFVLIEINNQTYSKALLSRNITGFLRKGENRLENINQEIVIS